MPRRLSVRAEDSDEPSGDQEGWGRRALRWVQNFFGVPSQHRDVRKWQARRRTIHTRRKFVSNNFGYFRRGLASKKSFYIEKDSEGEEDTDGAVERVGTERPSAVARQASEVSVSSTTANMADPGVIKPHVWQLAYHAMNTFAQPTGGGKQKASAQPKKSFYIEKDSEGEEETDGAVERSDSDSDDDMFNLFGPARLSPPPEEGEEDVDAAIPARQRPKSIRQQHQERRGKTRRHHPPVRRPGGSDDILKHEGLTGLLLRYRLARNEGESQGGLDLLFDHRPYFCYWVTIVQIVILIVSLSVYGVATIGLGIDQQPSDALDLSLDFRQVIRNVTNNPWIGPSQEALVLLGAKYAPCMRADQQLLRAFEQERVAESRTGCCVYNTGSGCYQSTQEVCQGALTTFVYNDSSVNPPQPSRVVCGQSPRTCLSPASNPPQTWDQNIVNWPICSQAESLTINGSQRGSNMDDLHLTCNVIGHPCCMGIQAQCVITTESQCRFQGGTYHPEAALCSQVDCFADVCGLLPFANPNHPDQVYRLWLALFMHSGLLHILPTLILHATCLRDMERHLGWLRTTIIYVGSGIFGNLLSAIVTPYYPTAGPYGCLMGILASFFVFIIMESIRLTNFKFDLVKLSVMLIFILAVGFLPYVDQWAHIGGFIMGFVLSGVLVPYIPPSEEELKNMKPKTEKAVRYIKYILLGVGVPLAVVLFVVFFLVFYLAQAVCDNCSYLTCPFQAGFTVCTDQTAMLRQRA